MKTPNAIDTPEAFKAALAKLIETNSLAVTLKTIALICRENSKSASEPKLVLAWGLAEKRVNKAYEEQMAQPGY